MTVMEEMMLSEAIDMKTAVRLQSLVMNSQVALPAAVSRRDNPIKSH